VQEHTGALVECHNERIGNMDRRELEMKVEVLEHDIAFLGRAIIRALKHIEYEETALQVQKMVDFHEWEKEQQ